MGRGRHGGVRNLQELVEDGLGQHFEQFVAAEMHDRVAAAVQAEVVPWALGTEPPELRVKADAVFGDVTPPRKRERRP
jgi:hypothetical protein